MVSTYHTEVGIYLSRRGGGWYLRITPRGWVVSTYVSHRGGGRYLLITPRWVGGIYSSHRGVGGIYLSHQGGGWYLLITPRWGRWYLSSHRGVGGIYLLHRGGGWYLHITPRWGRWYLFITPKGGDIYLSHRGGGWYLRITPRWGGWYLLILSPCSTFIVSNRKLRLSNPLLLSDLFLPVQQRQNAAYLTFTLPHLTLFLNGLPITIKSSSSCKVQTHYFHIQLFYCIVCMALQARPSVVIRQPIRNFVPLEKMDFRMTAMTGHTMQ